MPLTDTLWPWAVGAVCLLLVLRCAARQRHPVLAVLAGAVCGLGVLAVIALLEPVSGIVLPLNRWQSHLKYLACQKITDGFDWLVAGLSAFYTKRLSISSFFHCFSCSGAKFFVIMRLPPIQSSDEGSRRVTVSRPPKK